MPNFIARRRKSTLRLIVFTPRKSLITYNILAGTKPTKIVSRANSHGCLTGNVVSFTTAATYPRNTMALTSATTRIFTIIRLEENPPIVNSNGIFVGSTIEPKIYDNRDPNRIPRVAAIIKVYVSGKTFLDISLLREWKIKVSMVVEY